MVVQVLATWLLVPALAVTLSSVSCVTALQCPSSCVSASYNAHELQPGGEASRRVEVVHYNNEAEPYYTTFKTRQPLFSVCGQVPPGSTLNLAALGVPSGHAGTVLVWLEYGSPPSECLWDKMLPGDQPQQSVYLAEGNTAFSVTLNGTDWLSVHFGLSKVAGDGSYVDEGSGVQRYDTYIEQGVQVTSVQCQAPYCGGVCSDATRGCAAGMQCSATDLTCEPASPKAPFLTAGQIVGIVLGAAAVTGLVVFVRKQSPQAEATPALKDQLGGDQEKLQVDPDAEIPEDMLDIASNRQAAAAARTATGPTASTRKLKPTGASHGSRGSAVGAGGGSIGSRRRRRPPRRAGSKNSIGASSTSPARQRSRSRSPAPSKPVSQSSLTVPPS